MVFPLQEQLLTEELASLADDVRILQEFISQTNHFITLTNQCEGIDVWHKHLLTHSASFSENLVACIHVLHSAHITRNF